ncbi:hypothetical protein R6242_18770 [Iodobacter sp. CM08]|uniref:hypothetical protein n=1 Tax=Iodobacter sp. CM08 TaxID=3085902 RepID=UPI002981822B|nr:hypothetical protein [Iodobacter sp. CM08]MDW5418612.1 hypothetical protein [Iodobacter sp. CM08]
MTNETKKPNKVNPPSEFFRHLECWIDVRLFNRNQHTVDLFVKGGIKKISAAQKAYIGKVEYLDQIIDFPTLLGQLPKIEVSQVEINETKVVSNDENNVSDSIKPEILTGSGFNYKVHLVFESKKKYELMSIETAGEFTKTLNQNNVSDVSGVMLTAQAETRLFIEQTFSDAWRDAMSEVLYQIADVNNMVYVSKSMGGENNANTFVPVALPSPGVHTSQPTFRPSYRASSHKVSGFGLPSWPLWKWALLGVFLIGSMFVIGTAVTKLVSAKYAKNQPGQTSSLNLGSIAPEEIGAVVAHQKTAIENGGGDPYSGVDSGNQQIENMKKMGLSVGDKVDLGCLAN